ncbi:hypothetical protein F4820DRAFT_422127 [Hypoxylon rubiginosum]|uniref:Uncharacterized protein n=1 Tax=Hypoxylon rubiginosum TaxID=110542 RepID=A0ACB9Z0R9_9PEZI|nr:hypothetical protein F4820DRAFT_422127 [Hypoxylon rubiginosum]
MQWSTVSLLMVLVSRAAADLHAAAACIAARDSAVAGYEILLNATSCACELYKKRNTGSKQWDQCPDCTFDGLVCNSAAKHIGGDEMTYYCEEKCGAKGAQADS